MYAVVHTALRICRLLAFTPNTMYVVVLYLQPMYVCISMHGHHIYGLYVMTIHIAEYGMDQPGKVANPARGQLNRENEYSPVPVRA